MSLLIISLSLFHHHRNRQFNLVNLCPRRSILIVFCFWHCGRFEIKPLAFFGGLFSDLTGLIPPLPSSQLALPKRRELLSFPFPFSLIAPFQPIRSLPAGFLVCSSPRLPRWLPSCSGRRPLTRPSDLHRRPRRSLTTFPTTTIPRLRLTPSQCLISR